MTIKELPSGWFAIFADGIWIDAACRTMEQAQEKIEQMEREKK